jgi:clan AA aspartic protease
MGRMFTLGKGWEQVKSGSARKTEERCARGGRQAQACNFTRNPFYFDMGLASAKLLLDNPRVEAFEPIEVEALADSGALFLCIPDHIANQLQLKETSKKEITTADGKRQLCPYVGPVHVRFGNRECYVGAVVLGDQVLLGAVPMEDLDLVVIPSERRVVANPLNPNFAAGVAKGSR